ncbi:MAG: ABC transporter ATP-binding protein [Bacillota bacterium]|nr:ABC transporter ATP-binding protein [Bacillota bacterium]
MDRLLEVSDLEVSFTTYGGEVQAVRGVSFQQYPGETLALVGESGCGKTVTVHSIVKLIPMPPGRIKKGQILFDGRDLTALSGREIERVRGREIGIIFQDPMTALNPTMTVGRQISEGLIKHQGMTARRAWERSLELMHMVGIPAPEERIRNYPHQFSGGMRQRVMIGIALACNPKLLIADEPTTGLDVTIQAQILDLLKDLQKKLGTSIILITHDLGVVAGMAHRTAVMYAGRIVESGTNDDIFYRPHHPYTWGLMRAMPRLDRDIREDLHSIPGSPPDLFRPPAGCAFAARCPYSMKVCFRYYPEEVEVSPGHFVSCWLEHPAAAGVRPSREEVAAGAR